MDSHSRKRHHVSNVYSMDADRGFVWHSPTNSISPSRNSLTPSTSEKNLNLRFEHFSTESSQLGSNLTPRTALRQEKEIHKPISLVIIEKYFSDICQCMSATGTIEVSFLCKASTMQDVLKDCLTAVPDLSLQFYVLMASALKEIQEIHSSQSEHLYSTLSKKLLQLASLIEENKYTSKTERAYTQPQEEIVEITGMQELGKELNVRVTRVTARILNIWKKILCPQREAAVISCSFLLLYCEIDSNLKISPTARIPIDKAIVVMKNYIGNPGYVVTILRKTKEYIDKEMISVETIRRIHELLSKITVEQVKNVDKTLTGFTIYELVVYAVRYYQAYAKEHYGIDVFEKSHMDTFDSEISSIKDKELDLDEFDKEPPKPKVIKKVQDKAMNKLARTGLNVSHEEVPKKVQEAKPSPFKKTPEKILKKSKGQTEEIHPKKLLNANENNLKPSLKNVFKPSPSRGKISSSPSIKSSQEKSLISLSPQKSSPFKSPSKKSDSEILSSKPLDKSIIAAKQILSSNNTKTNSNKTTPVRTRNSIINPRSSDPSPINRRDVLEEMQYQQFIEEKFRHFLIDKLRKETEKLLKSGLDRNDIKIVNEVRAGKSKVEWIQEFEKSTGIIRFNATKKLSDDKRYTAELIRAQKQLEILERYSSEY